MLAENLDRSGFLNFFDKKGLCNYWTYVLRIPALAKPFSNCQRKP
jgi:hypothetical protein